MVSETAVRVVIIGMISSVMICRYNQWKESPLWQVKLVGWYECIRKDIFVNKPATESGGSMGENPTLT